MKYSVFLRLCWKKTIKKRTRNKEYKGELFYESEALSPAHLLGLDEFELHAAAGPGDEVGVGRVVQQSHQELPELQRASALVRRALAVQAGLLLDVTCGTRNGPLPHGVSARLHMHTEQVLKCCFNGIRREDSPSTFSGTTQVSS